jgi:hypothetical protein
MGIGYKGFIRGVLKHFTIVVNFSMNSGCDRIFTDT